MEISVIDLSFCKVITNDSDSLILSLFSTNKSANKNNSNSPNKKLNYKVIDLSNETSINQTVDDVLEDGAIDLLVITSAISNEHSQNFPMLNENTTIFKKFMMINSMSHWLIIRKLFPKITQLNASIKIIVFTSKAGKHEHSKEVPSVVKR